MPPSSFGPPRFPFTGWPIQVIDERLGYMWFVEPNVFINQAQVTQADAAAAVSVHGWIDKALAARRDTIVAAGGLVIMHDWRALKGYDSDARRIFLDRMRSRPAGYLKAAYAIVPPTPFFRMAIQAANLVAALRGGGRVEIATDPGPILARLGVAPPAPNTPFPGERG